MKHEKRLYPYFEGSKYISGFGWVPLEDVYGGTGGEKTKIRKAHRGAGGVRIAILAEGNGMTIVPFVMNSWSMDCYKFAGGKVEPGESLKEAAIRETLEETGIVLTEKDLTQLGEEMTDVKGYPLHFFVAHTDIVLYSKQIKREGDEGEIVAQFPYDVLRDKNFLNSPPSRDNPPLFWDHRKLAQLLDKYVEALVQQ